MNIATWTKCDFLESRFFSNSLFRRIFLEHRAEKWVPVFGKSDATTINYSIVADSEIGHDAVVEKSVNSSGKCFIERSNGEVPAVAA